MNGKRLSDERRKINYLYDQIGSFKGDDEILAHLVKYLCILSNGHIEESLRIIYNNYVYNKSSHKNISNYVSRDLKQFRNPNPERILTLASKFSPDWRKELEQFLTDEMNESLSSIVNVKNALAHGQNSSITYANLKRYWDNVQLVLDFIENQCKRS